MNLVSATVLATIKMNKTLPAMRVVKVKVTRLVKCSRGLIPQKKP